LLIIMVSGGDNEILPDPRFTRALDSVPAGQALDLACGRGRHAIWLAGRGWTVTAVDIRDDLIQTDMPGISYVRADLERGDFVVEPHCWDLIVCWLYWQPNLLAPTVRGVRENGYVALAGKTSGRFTTSLERYRAAFNGWREIDAGEHERITWFIARR
jgi:SAM-dependent methyltransferase